MMLTDFKAGGSTMSFHTHTLLSCNCLYLFSCCVHTQDMADFSSAQLEACAAVCDTFFPERPELDHISAAVASNVVAVVSKWEDPSAKKLMSLSLHLLSSGLGTLALGGTFSITSSFPFFHRFSHLPCSHRQKILRTWSLSRFTLLRLAFKIFKTLACWTVFSQVDEMGRNRRWDAMEYPGPDPARDDEDNGNAGPLAAQVVDLHAAAAQGGGVETVVQAAAKAGCRVVRDVRELQEVHRGGGKEVEVGLECDVVVVGSGSGGGVVAGVLAQAGYKVVVVEKGRYYARRNLSLLEGDAWSSMLEQGGLLTTEDGNVAMLAGATVGGGTAINWCASFKTPPHVRKEWAEEMGLHKFGREEYEAAMDAVCSRIGVREKQIPQESLQNQVLRKGCQKLGFPVGTIPRNAPPHHTCGWCSLGCWSGAKQATSETWLLDAVEADAVILTGCKAEAVLHQGRRARGVVAAIAGSEMKLYIKARATVVAAGSLHTPDLLLRSGFTNPNIGQHLHLHPVVLAWGCFPDAADLPGSSYEGAIMSAFSTVCADWEGSGYGALLQTPSFHPAAFAINMPWVSAGDMEERMRRYRRTAHLLVLCRDVGSGSVRAGPRVRYQVGQKEEEHLMQGMVAALRVLIAAGASEVGSHQADGERWKVESAGVESYLERVRKRGLRKLETPITSAHQMGSCRMGIHPSSSVVQPSGETWETQGLFLADASVFPSATGVNPMVTAQSIAFCTARSIEDFLNRHQHS